MNERRVALWRCRLRRLPASRRGSSSPGRNSSAPAFTGQTVLPEDGRQAHLSRTAAGHRLRRHGSYGRRSSSSPCAWAPGGCTAATVSSSPSVGRDGQEPARLASPVGPPAVRTHGRRLDRAAAPADLGGPARHAQLRVALQSRPRAPAAAVAGSASSAGAVSACSSSSIRAPGASSDSLQRSSGCSIVSRERPGHGVLPAVHAGADRPPRPRRTGSAVDDHQRGHARRAGRGNSSDPRRDQQRLVQQLHIHDVPELAGAGLHLLVAGDSHRCGGSGGAGAAPPVAAVSSGARWVAAVAPARAAPRPPRAPTRVVSGAASCGSAGRGTLRAWAGSAGAARPRR